MRRKLTREFKDRLKVKFKEDHFREPEPNEEGNLETDTGYLVDVLIEKVDNLEVEIKLLKQRRISR